MRPLLIAIALFIALTVAFGQKTPDTTSIHKKTHVFVGYELGEMIFNNFLFFAGETGLQFKNKHMLRLTYMNVKLTEKHLSSDFANVVDGNNVKGIFKGYELFYDLPVYKNLHLGGSAGYYNDYYEHTEKSEDVNHKTATIGFEINYRETDIFNIKGLYFNLALPFRFYINPLEKTTLGNATVNRHFFENNIWFFVGYQF